MRFKCGCAFDKDFFSKGIAEQWDSIPLDCPDTWDMIGEGLTKGIFQLEKSLGKNWCRKLKPRNLEELADVISLIRPGCLEAEYREDPKTGKMLSITRAYRKVKSGELQPEYLHESLEPIFSSTYGAPVYQEQIMEICRQFAGFSLQEADVARKAVGKKDKHKMEIVHKKFIEGAVANGHDPEMAEVIFSWIDKFSGYGFNKCVSGDTLLNRGAANQHGSGLIAIEHLYKLVNDYDYAKSLKKIPLRKKLRRYGYGKCMAVCPDGRVRPMPIKTIHYNGKKKVVRVTDNGGREIVCTLDHKFMTPEGVMSPISKIGVGGKIMCHVDTYDDEYIYNYNVHKKTRRGNQNDLIDSIGRKNTALIDGNWKKFENIKREDYRLGRNKRFDKGHKTGIATIVRIESLDKEIDTYDVEMDTPEHNWVANGFVVSNSHAVGYAMLGYRTAYAKMHMKTEFFKNMLDCSDSKQDEHDEIKELVHEARLFGINVKLPDVRVGNKNFHFTKAGDLMFGLAHIKNVGPSALSTLKPLKKAKSEQDLFRLMLGNTKIKKNVSEALIKAGAVDYAIRSRVRTLGRFRMLSKLTKRELEFIMDSEDLLGKPSSTWLESLVENKVPRPINKRIPKITAAWDEIKKELGGDRSRLSLSYEKFHLGMAISGSETDLYFNEKVDTTCQNFLNLKSGTRVTLGVLIEEIRKTKDKRGDEMAFMKVSDDTYMLDGIVVFSRVFAKCSWILEEGKVVMVRGKKQDTSLLVDSIDHL